jgi:hypothetical protein
MWQISVIGEGERDLSDIICMLKLYIGKKDTGKNTTATELVSQGR